MKIGCIIIVLYFVFACTNSTTQVVSNQEYTSVMKLDTQQLSEVFDKYKESSLYHRRFKHYEIDSLVKLHQSKSILGAEEIGKSLENRTIYELTYGKGTKKVMLWSQMHGDEPTATMALFDLFNFLEGEGDGYDEVRRLLNDKLRLIFIPMLNPDGAERFQRRNAQSIDLNRDARAVQTVEGKLLKTRAKAIQPQYGFNLHDQNIYYNVPGTRNAVTISMLAPAYNTDRDINAVREGAMQIIVGMNELLQAYIPDAVAKYDDTHSPRGFGDNFQSWNASTVLIESGGLKGDVEKQQIRKLNFIIILNALMQIAQDSYKQFDKADYEKIPFNASQLHDVVIRNLTLRDDSIKLKTDIAIRRGEVTVGKDYFVRGRVEDLGDLQDGYGYDEVDAEGLYFIPGKVATKAVSNHAELSQESALSLLRQGFIASPVKTRSEALHTLPIHLFTQKQFFPTTVIDLGGTANFFIGSKSGQLKYAMVNGYLIDLEKGLHGQVIKNRIH